MSVTQHVRFTSGGRYPVLRSIGIIYVFLGAIAILGGIAAVLWMLFRAPFDMTDRVILAGAAVVASVFWGALMLGAAEIIKLFVDLEHNTRMASMHRPMTPGIQEMSKTDGNLYRVSAFDDEETAEAALIRGH